MATIAAQRRVARMQASHLSTEPDSIDDLKASHNGIIE
jgi:hypothetical protein